MLRYMYIVCHIFFMYSTAFHRYDIYKPVFKKKVPWNCIWYMFSTYCGKFCKICKMV